MRTVILPGFSYRNKEWADSLAKDLNVGGEVVVHNWSHWETGSESDFKEDYEYLTVVKLIGNEKVNILAKSVGTAIACKLLKNIPDKINKVVLCGIPFLDKERYSSLANFPSERIIVIQNTSDPLGSYDAVKKFVETLNSKINVVKKEAATHDYPYPEDFSKFLK